MNRADGAEIDVLERLELGYCIIRSGMFTMFHKA